MLAEFPEAQRIVEDMCGKAEPEVAGLEIKQGKNDAHHKGWDALHQVSVDASKGKRTDDDGPPTSGGQHSADDTVAEYQFFRQGTGKNNQHRAPYTVLHSGENGAYSRIFYVKRAENAVHSETDDDETTDAPRPIPWQSPRKCRQSALPGKAGEEHDADKCNGREQKCRAIVYGVNVAQDGVQVFEGGASDVSCPEFVEQGEDEGENLVQKEEQQG